VPNAIRLGHRVGTNREQTRLAGPSFGTIFCA
jgi:hypothetical protein